MKNQKIQQYMYVRYTINASSIFAFSSRCDFFQPKLIFLLYWRKSFFISIHSSKKGKEKCGHTRFFYYLLFNENCSHNNIHFSTFFWLENFISKQHLISLQSDNILYNLFVCPVLLCHLGSCAKWIRQQQQQPKTSNNWQN